MARSDALAAMGCAMGPPVVEACRALFDGEQRALADRVSPRLVDAVYGPDPRHRIDLYGGGDDGAARPVILFVHGGGFRLGDKGDGGSWQNAAIGRLAAETGWLGAVMNYRLLPDAQWPSGGQDVLAALDWLVAHAADHGGDPARIILVGTSAGAVHIATALRLRPELGAAGLVLLSGLYGITPLDEKDLPYYGAQSDYADRMPLGALTETRLPLFLACAEHDPPRFQAEFLGLMQARLDHHGVMPRGTIVSGHNHYSLAMHLGTGDRRLADEIIAFVGACAAG